MTPVVGKSGTDNGFLLSEATARRQFPFGMSRRARIVSASYPKHTILRGIDRTAIFFAEPDRCMFLATLAELAAAESVGVHAYVLMTNHVHLLMTPDLPRIPSQGFQASRPKGFSYTLAPFLPRRPCP